MDIPSADLARIRDLYSNGRYRAAHDIATGYGPMREWAGTPARLIGGRLAIQLGAPNLGRQLHLLAFRSTPGHPEAIYYHARYRMERFGAFATWQFLRKHPDWSDSPPELHADWLALNGFVAARLRDFDRAERWLNRAEAVAPNRPWPSVERASAYELADRYDDALAAGRRSLELHPWFRPGVQAVAHVLIRMGRETEALEFLTEAVTHLESGLVLAQLAALQNDLGHHADAARSLDRYAELTPLLEPDVAKWLAARRADTAYFLGDLATAATHARSVGEDFYNEFVERVDAVQASSSPDTLRSRIVVPVDLAFDRTPPTVYELLARFWKQPLAGPPIDATLPLDGLPDAAERNRAEQAGWITREFTLSAEAAIELLGRGVPFIVTLVETGYSQARLAVGIDPLRSCLSLADGHERRPIEAPLTVLLDRFSATGPRCLALVPEAEAQRLDGLTLPDAAVRDTLYAVQKALQTYDRLAATTALQKLRDDFPDHLQTLYGELALARADAHPVKTLRALDSLLARFPHEATFVLGQAAILRELNCTAERTALLEAEAAEADAEPMVMQSLAQVLLPLPNRQVEVDWLLRRSVRARPTAAAGYFLLATQWWEQRRFDEAAEVYRFACAAEEREDQFAEAYFRAARATEQVPEALRLFQQRAGRAAVPTPSAARSLYNALMDREEPEQAFAALDQAIRKLQANHEASPTPAVGSALGELLMFRGECHAGFGRNTEAEADLATARPLVPAGTWLRAAARIARLKPDLPAAVVHTLELLKLDPLSIEGHRYLVVLLTDTDGRTAARTHLGQACQRYPHYYPLLKLRTEYISGDPDADADHAIADMIAECPDDAWALRQRALVLADRKRHAEALAAITRAGELEPGHPWYYGVCAQVHRRADRADEALNVIREGLRQNIDQEPLISELLHLSRGRQEKQESLQFLAAELAHQPHTGEALVAYVTHSHQMIDGPEGHQELLESLEQILDERPDLWQAWSAVIQQMAGMNRLDEAASLAREATDRFPLLAKLWLDRAHVADARGNAEGRIDYLREAVALSPGWSPAARDLAEALSDSDNPEDAIAVLQRNAARSPTDPMAHRFLAEWLWDAGQSREALDRAKLALRHEPGYDWAWHAVQLWAEQSDCPEEPAELARELTRERAGDPRVWLRLARLLSHPRHNDEVLAALERAVALDPKNVEAHDLRAERLAEMGRFDEAIAAAQPPQFVADPPFILQGRLAWVEARRGNYAAAIPPMHALVSVDPKYVWGWHQLAEWYNETGRPEGYLEAASELARLQPGHPVALTMRGEAKLQTGDREGGKADLRDTLKESPHYSLAAAILFEAHLEDEEYREARQALAVLQEHAGGPEVAVKQLQLACRTGDEDAAVRAFTEVCEGPGQSPYPIQQALTELRDVGWEGRGLKVLRDSWQSGSPFHPWAPIFWIDSPDGQEAEPDTRLRAAEAIIRAYPKFIPGHDSKIEQLALAGRYEEALAACKPAELGDPPPVELRGRSAWVEARRGDRARAITIMKTLVTEKPDYILGWRQLAAWYDMAGRHRECLEAADRFVALEPQNPVALIYRGEARRGLADRRGALADFQKAFDLDPSFEAAGINLITEQLAAGDTAGAARTLGAVREHADSPLVRLRAVQVACRQNEFEQAMMHLRALIGDEEATRTMLQEAMTAFDAESWSTLLTAELRSIVQAGDATPDLAAIWAERAVAAGSQDAVVDLLPELLSQHPEIGREVLLAYLWAEASSGKPVQSVIQKHSEILRGDDVAWAKAGRALVAAGHFAHGAAWLADYRERADLQVWMLHPLALALRSLDQDDKAVEVCRAAVRLGGPEELLGYFRVWLGLDLALSGQSAEASAQLSRVDGTSVPDSTRVVLALAEAVLMVRHAGPAGKAAAFNEARDHLKTAAGSCPPKDIPVGAGRAFRKVVAVVVADVGTLSARLWAVWQRVRPWVR